MKQDKDTGAFHFYEMAMVMLTRHKLLGQGRADMEDMVQETSGICKL